MTPPAKNAIATMSQMTPHTAKAWTRRVSKRERKEELGARRAPGGGYAPCDGQQPQISANADASEPFTFRAIVSSARARG